MTDKPAPEAEGTQLPRAAVGTFPYDHRTLAQVDEDRQAMLGTPEFKQDLERAWRQMMDSQGRQD